MVIVAGVVIVVALLVLVGVRAIIQPSSSAQSGDAPASASVVQAVTNVPASTLDAVGRGSANTLPTAVGSTTSKGPNGHPLVTYIGAEYCPYCAGERWAMVVALSRFGTFSNLKQTTSAANDVYPSTRTFSFYGATYTSQYVDFDSAELQSNVPASGGGYQSLQKPTAAQTQMIQKYDAPPYVKSTSSGAIPFVNFGNRFVSVGASFDVGVLQGQSWDQIATSLSNPSSSQAKAVLGAANVLTATICQVTGDTPSNVCGDQVIRGIEASLASEKPPAGAH